MIYEVNKNTFQTLKEAVNYQNEIQNKNKDNQLKPNYIKIPDTITEHTCTIKLKHAHGYQCPECYRITK